MPDEQLLALSPNELSPAAAAGGRERSFDEDWLFWRGELEGVETPEFDDAHWRQLHLPHDWSIEDLPGATGDAARATAAPALWDEAEGAPDAIGPFDRLASGGGRNTGYTVGGIGWYRKHFLLPPDAVGRRVELRFDGAYKDVDVWLNGR